MILIAGNYFELSAQITNNQTTTQRSTSTSSANFTNSVSSSPQLKINGDMSDILLQTGNQPMLTPGVPIEGTINADKYIVGPNDLFMLGIYGYVNQQIQLYVNPEGSVTIPTVGEIYLSDLSLTKAKEKVVAAVKRRYYSSSVSFNLATPRAFIINISGMVEGKYQVTSLTRASELLRLIMYDTLNLSRRYLENQYKNTSGQNSFRTQMSMRNIIIKRKNGSESKVDVYKYFMTGDEQYNPYLLEGDLINIPYVLYDKNYVSVTGAVQLGGFYEYSDEDDLETLIGLGRGFDTYADKDSILLLRSYTDKPGYEQIDLSFEKDKKFKINLFDRVFVKYNTQYQKMATVLVLGEVQRPGYYPLSYKNTKIRDIIDMAGGLKNTACLPLSILFRYWDDEYSPKDSAEIYINQRANDLLITPNDRTNFQVDLKSRRNRVILDFDKLLNKNDESQNLLLEDKDIIYINDNKNVVYVYGQVNNEGFVTYVPGKDYEYYIEKAGGYGLAADEGDTRIIKFNSRGWYKPDKTIIENGDFVYVPKQDKKPFAENFSLIATGVTLLISIITTYLLYRNYNK
jgi:polysaccharide biosynthesis/export protein